MPCVPVRFSVAEAAALIEYAKPRGLRRATAVRQLLALGLKTVAANDFNQATMGDIYARLSDLQTGLTALAGSSGQTLRHIERTAVETMIGARVLVKGQAPDTYSSLKELRDKYFEKLAEDAAGARVSGARGTSDPARR